MKIFVYFEASHGRDVLIYKDHLQIIVIQKHRFIRRYFTRDNTARGENIRKMKEFGEISEIQLLQWEKFPELIRSDKCFSLFQTEAKYAAEENACLVADKNEKVSSTSHSYWKSLKHVIFALVWTIAAWHLLTVKEKVLHKVQVAVDAQHSQGG